MLLRWLVQVSFILLESFHLRPVLGFFSSSCSWGKQAFRPCVIPVSYVLCFIFLLFFFHHLYFYQDSLPDIVYSLVWILEYKNRTTSSIVANVAIKLVGAIPNALLKTFHFGSFSCSFMFANFSSNTNICSMYYNTEFDYFKCTK